MLKITREDVQEAVLLGLVALAMLAALPLTALILR